jgi:hypothetical protein
VTFVERAIGEVGKGKEKMLKRSTIFGPAGQKVKRASLTAILKMYQKKCLKNISL